MRIGLIARAEIARGLAIQSKNFYDHLPVDSVLLVEMPKPDCDLGLDWYREDHTLRVPYNDFDHTLPEEAVRGWLDGLDVVFTVETPYDWRLPNWAREAGVKTVVQGNPEFYRKHLASHAHQANPDEWWWPTSWRPIRELPQGTIMPVPMDRVHRAVPPGDTLELLHVVGKRAWMDRNGTDTLLTAMRAILRPVRLGLHALENDIMDLPRQRRVTYDVVTQPVVDRWSMYEGRSVLVLPRKYGGLCLPALEAAASGLAVLMPDISPNHELASILTPIGGVRPTNLACGLADIARINPHTLAMQLSQITDEEWVRAQQQSWDTVPTWDEWAPRYMEEFERVCNR
jgi:glycosyltransferase involved in cell wall biosynthesis